MNNPDVFENDAATAPIAAEAQESAASVAAREAHQFEEAASKATTPEEERTRNRFHLIAGFADAGVNFPALEEAAALVPELKKRVEELERKIEHHGIVGPR